eukprot:TRINITY_DN11990_c0_g2_i1.p2 TRINITY_DN11990_c0_g2~~TRINITY_DN11990_c0_g2_i1.p2  ORF type:complete len:154 (+),score=31.54 TRINITY_DN11990_c0_g2_i1:722-1183(+)
MKDGLSHVSDPFNNVNETEQHLPALYPASQSLLQEHFEKAIELNPADATSKHLLGVWCFSFADLPWYQRQAASAVFATPPSATYEEALTYFQAAETTEPGFYAKNAYYLGVTHARMGNKADAKQWLQACINMPASNADDREAHELAHAALKSL